VGFRPFVYNLATRLQLTGHILNNKLGVSIEIQGEPSVCEKFIHCLSSEAPPLSRISRIRVRGIPLLGPERAFRIAPSEENTGEVGLISPDNDVCPECLKELFNPEDRRYRYPFINCTDCGPRYTLIQKTPYDRPRTSMSGFRMCPACQAEYDDPSSRRFHAQPNACPVCGPSVRLLNDKGDEVFPRDPVEGAIDLIRQGKILAVKGVGGYHLVCDATKDSVCGELRRRKLRGEKPFAVMSADINAVHAYAHVNPTEKRLLLSRERPIVLLKKKKEGLLASSIAPGMEEYGVFLPYTPMHYLLFAPLKNGPFPIALVMTSGNVREEPIVFDEKELRPRLGGMADFFLVNNRPIAWRCDDSVVRQVQDRTMVLRRSRGWVPAPVFLDERVPAALACGGDLKNVFCLGKGETVFPGPYIGDLENAEAFRSFKGSIEHFKKIFEISPEFVAVDAHPNYFSSRYGRSLGLPVMEIQHHHSHIVSVMAENRLNGQVIGLALDGTGYGTDGTLWGGEMLVCDTKTFTRWGHLPPLRLPGGDRAVQEPWRTAVALLYDLYGEEMFIRHPEFVQEIGEERIWKILKTIQANLNCPVSTGAGRWFDAIASLLLLRHCNTFEGQAPMLLEAVSDKAEKGDFGSPVGDGGKVDFRDMIRDLIRMAGQEKDRARGAAMFHNTLARALLTTCLCIRKETGLTRVCLGGGTFQNARLSGGLQNLLAKEQFEVYLPIQLPVNDGGLALGQIVIGAALANAGE